MDTSNDKLVLLHARKPGNFESEAESLSIAAQNNVIMTNYIKAKFNNTQQNSKWYLKTKGNSLLHDKQRQ